MDPGTVPVTFLWAKDFEVTVKVDMDLVGTMPMPAISGPACELMIDPSAAYPSDSHSLLINFATMPHASKVPLLPSVYSRHLACDPREL